MTLDSSVIRHTEALAKRCVKLVLAFDRHGSINPGTAHELAACAPSLPRSAAAPTQGGNVTCWSTHACIATAAAAEALMLRVDPN